MRVGEREGERERGGGVRTIARLACFREKLDRTSSKLWEEIMHVIFKDTIKAILYALQLGHTNKSKKVAQKTPLL